MGIKTEYWAKCRVHNCLFSAGYWKRETVIQMAREHAEENDGHAIEIIKIEVFRSDKAKKHGA